MDLYHYVVRVAERKIAGAAQQACFPIKNRYYSRP